MPAKRKLNILLFSLLMILLISSGSKAQDTLRLYLNAGYMTNFSKCEACEKADQGGSVRIGILNQRRMGYYFGYTWFKEYNADYIDYDDKGSLFIAGIDIRLLNKNKFQTYLKMGLACEFYTSTYVNVDRTETEISLKPDLGLLWNIHHFNIYTGWQPSDPGHINIGIGLTLDI